MLCSTMPTIASHSTTLATPRNNLTTIFDSHNDPQSRRWGTSYVRRWGTSPGQGMLLVYPSDYSWLHGPLPIPTCFLSFIYLCLRYRHLGVFLVLTRPRCPAPLTSVDTWSRSRSQGSCQGHSSTLNIPTPAIRPFALSVSQPGPLTIVSRIALLSQLEQWGTGANPKDNTHLTPPRG